MRHLCTIFVYLALSLSLHGRYTDWLPLSLRQTICVYLEVVWGSSDINENPPTAPYSNSRGLGGSYRHHIPRGIQDARARGPNFPQSTNVLLQHRCGDLYITILQDLFANPQWSSAFSANQAGSRDCLQHYTSKQYPALETPFEIYFSPISTLGHWPTWAASCQSALANPECQKPFADLSLSQSRPGRIWSPESAQAQTMLWT